MQSGSRLAVESPARNVPPRPVILGTGLTGLAISRALSQRGIDHVLIGAPPTATPRLGESLNAEGSVEIARQFPEQAKFFFRKQRVALFFDGRAVAFESLDRGVGRAMFAPLFYPEAVDLLHVDRLGFDRSVFEAAVADDHCRYLNDRPVALDLDPARQRIETVQLGDAGAVPAGYVFDATNHQRFVARKLGVACRPIGGPRRVVFAHYQAGDGGKSPPPAWSNATSLLRLDRRTDPVDGLAWCIPLGDYVSLGISVDPERTGANPGLMLDWLEKAYARRGLDVRRSFANRGSPADFAYEHYTHERCYGRNWLLAGPSCCQIWFPSGAGVASGLIAARLAPDILKAPQQAAVYQQYIDRIAASHQGLAWMTEGDPWAVSEGEVRQRARAMARGSVRRFARYLDLAERPAELAFGDALRRFYEEDRRLLNPVRVATEAVEAQAGRVFAGGGAGGEPDIAVPASASRTKPLRGPGAVLRVAAVLSGPHRPDAAAEALAPDVALHIDEFTLRGFAMWRAWVDWLRRSPRIEGLRLVPLMLDRSGEDWVLTGYWQGTRQGRQAASAQFSIGFSLADDRIAAIRTRRADHVVATGESVLPPVAFAAMLGQWPQEAAGGRATGPAER